MKSMWHSFKKLLSRFIIIDENAFESANDFFKEYRLSKGEFLVKEGTVCNQLAYVNQGILRSFYINEKGEDITYCFCADNDIETSFKSFLLGEPSSISIQALEDTSLLIIDKTDLQLLFDTHLFWSKIGRLLTEQEYLKVELHASAVKNESAKAKYLRLVEERPILLQKVPLHYIASYLGISNRHLTRLRKEILQAHVSDKRRIL